MFEYRSEIVKAASLKLLSTKANANDLEILDAVISERAEEGWELVTYIYSSSPLEAGAKFIATFKRPK